MSEPDFAAWTEALLPVVEAAGQAILEVQRGEFAINAKADASPVTIADQRSEAIVLAALEQLTPRFPIVAEERVAAEGLPDFDGEDFWLVDALDGTREFIQKRNDFTVNIGLIRNGAPVFGIVHPPARGDTYVGIVPTQTALHYRDGTATRIQARPRPARVTVVGSKSHEIPEEMNAFLAKYDVAERVSVGSSLKFCLVAKGEADLYPRFGPTSEWDTAAGDAVVRAAGGSVRSFDGAPLRYKKPKFLNVPFLVEGA